MGSEAGISRRIGGRLRLELIQDLLDLSPESMADMKREIWQVVSSYMAVYDEFIGFEIRRLDELMLLVSNIQGQELNRVAPAQAPIV